MADKKPDPTPVLQNGVGLDIGTMNLVAARKDADGVVTTRMRDVFLDIPVSTSARKMLKLSDMSYVEREDAIIVLGDAAMELANVFGKTPRRPLSAGLISPDEMDSLEVLQMLISKVLGKPRVADEVCYFSVPAEPIDQDRDVIYHRGVFENIVASCGFKPIPANEAMGIIFSETSKDGFSGLAMSFGSGMVNVALSISTIEGLSFSVARGGDWIDTGAAKSTGSTQARICAIKEKGVNLTDPKGRDQQAIVFYYEAMITYVLDQIEERFNAIRGKFDLPRAIPLIVSGGTSKAEGFMEFFTAVFEKKRGRFPIEISEIRHASDPLNSVAYGLLVQAMQEYDDG